GDCSKVLEFIEEALDEVAFAVEREVAGTRDLAGGLWRDHRSDSPLVQAVDERISVEGLVADQGIGIDGFDQRRRASQIVGLPRREYQFDRIAQGIDEGMDFGGQSA